MTTPKDISERFWNQPHKGVEEDRREMLFMDDIIQKAHLDCEIEARLEGVRTVFDGGAGSGRFSLSLAKRGLEVLHYDISAPMIEKARENAARQGLRENLTFRKGSLEELGQFKDGQFDLVLSLDAPVSYTHPNHAVVLRDLVRISRRAVVVSVSSRLGYVPYLLNPRSKEQYLVDENADDPSVRFYRDQAEKASDTSAPSLDAIGDLLETGLTESPDRAMAAFDRGESPWPVNYLFMPEELSTLLAEAGLSDIRCSGPGALARSVPRPMLRKLLLSPEYREQFLRMCYRFDSHPSVAGLGKDNLVASGVARGR